MKRILLLIFCLCTMGKSLGQTPVIQGDLMLCPWTNGTASVVNQTYDTYQWYSKYWFVNDPYVAISGANQSSFTYDWYTYDQSLFKVVATLNGVTYESNVIQLDSYAWVGMTLTYELNDNVTFDPNTEAYLLCAGGSFNIMVNSPYNASIQWFKDGVAIAGANTTNYLVTGPGTYYVVAAPDYCPDSTSNNEGLPLVVNSTTDCNLSVENPVSGKKGIQLYPNPASDILTLDLSGAMEYNGYSIIDASGKVLVQKELNPGQNTEQINVSTLSNGFYILKLKGDNVSTIKRFIKN